MIRFAMVAAVALVTTAAMPSVARGATRAPQPAVRAALRADLNGYLHAYRDTEHISAVSLAVTFPGRGRSFDLAVGSNRYRGGSAISPDELWQIGSNTKAFTSVLALKLEAAHKLSIDDTLGKWLPQYPAWSGVTIRQLLNMTSGIPNYTDSPNFWLDLAAAPNRAFSASSLVAYAVGLPPTQGYSYSNTNYILAQMIIERASDDTYASQLQKRIVQPLGLHDTFFSAKSYGRTVTDRMPAGYWFVTALPGMPLGQDESRSTVSWAQGAGGIVSSLQDLATWDRALFDGRELPTKQQRELTSLVSTSTGKPIRKTTLADDEGYGLGVDQVTSKALGTLWYYEGETDGFRVLNMYAPRSGTAITIGLNSAALTDHTAALGTSVFETLRAAGLS